MSYVRETFLVKIHNSILQYF